LKGPGFPKEAIAAGSMVLEMAFLAVGGLLAGAWLDGISGAGPLFLVLLTLAGFVLGILRILRVLKNGDHDSSPKDPR